jgi:hypothetical protein
MFNAPQQLKLVNCYNGAANAVACDVVSMKNLIRGWFVVLHNGANDTDLTLSLYQATDVAAGTNKAVTAAQANYLDADQGASSDTLAKQTDAYAITIDPATQNGVMWVLEVDPTTLDLANGYDCVYLADSGGNASNLCTILFVGLMNFQGASLPSVIVD